MYGELIKQMRIESGYTQSALSKQLGIAQNTLSEFETNIKSTKLDLLLHVAKICNYSIIIKDNDSDEEIIIEKK